MRKDGSHAGTAVDWLLGDLPLGEFKGSLVANGYTFEGTVIPNRSLKLSVLDKSSWLTVIDRRALEKLGAKDLPAPQARHDVPFHYLANRLKQDVLIQIRPEVPVRQMSWLTVLPGVKDAIAITVDLMGARDEVLSRFEMRVSEVTRLQFAWVNEIDYPRFAVVRFYAPPGLIVGPFNEAVPPT